MSTYGSRCLTKTNPSPGSSARRMDNLHPKATDDGRLVTGRRGRGGSGTRQWRRSRDVPNGRIIVKKSDGRRLLTSYSVYVGNVGCLSNKLFGQVAARYRRMFGKRFFRKIRVQTFQTGGFIVDVAQMYTRRRIHCRQYLVRFPRFCT